MLFNIRNPFRLYLERPIHNFLTLLWTAGLPSNVPIATATYQILGWVSFQIPNACFGCAPGVTNDLLGLATAFLQSSIGSGWILQCFLLEPAGFTQSFWNWP